MDLDGRLTEGRRYGRELSAAGQEDRAGGSCTGEDQQDDNKDDERASIAGARIGWIVGHRELLK